MDQLPPDFIHKSTEQIAMMAIKELGYKMPFKIVLVDAAEYAMFINVDKAGPQIVWQSLPVSQSAPEVFRFPVHVMVSDRTPKLATYFVLESGRSKPKLHVVK